MNQSNQQSDVASSSKDVDSLFTFQPSTAHYSRLYVGEIIEIQEIRDARKSEYPLDGKGDHIDFKFYRTSRGKERLIKKESVIDGSGARVTGKVNDVTCRIVSNGGLVDMQLFDTQTPHKEVKGESISILGEKGYAYRLGEGDSFTASMYSAQKGEHPASDGAPESHTKYFVLTNPCLPCGHSNSRVYNPAFVKKGLVESKDLKRLLGTGVRSSFTCVAASGDNNTKPELKFLASPLPGSEYKVVVQFSQPGMLKRLGNTVKNRVKGFFGAPQNSHSLPPTSPKPGILR